MVVNFWGGKKTDFKECHNREKCCSKIGMGGVGEILEKNWADLDLIFINFRKIKIWYYTDSSMDRNLSE